VISRRSMLGAGVWLLGAPFVNRGRYRLFASDSRQYSAQTLDLIRSTTVVGMLGLLMGLVFQAFHGPSFPSCAAI